MAERHVHLRLNISYMSMVCYQFLKCFKQRLIDCSFQNCQQNIRDSPKLEMLLTL